MKALKTIITIALLATSFNSVAAESVITCEQATQRVESNVDYLWSLKGNTKQVSEAVYTKAYKTMKKVFPYKLKFVASNPDIRWYNYEQ